MQTEIQCLDFFRKNQHELHPVTVAGYGTLTDGLGTDVGVRPVRWEAGSTAPTQLDVLRTNNVGYTWTSIQTPSAKINEHDWITWHRYPLAGASSCFGFSK
jgi:hypothetical protein